MQLIRVIAICMLCLAAAPHLAHAQDCSTALGQRVCANPDLSALEQERQTLQSELAGLNPEHATLAEEQGWLAAQETCPDDECLRAGLLDRNQSLRLAIAAQSPPDESIAELPTIPDIAPTRESESEAGDGPREINPDPPFRIQDYFGALIAIPLAFLIAFWLLGKAARARRGE